MAKEELIEDEEVEEEAEEIIEDEIKETDVIRIRTSTKKKLDARKAHPSMSYDAVISAYVDGAGIDWNKKEGAE